MGLPICTALSNPSCTHWYSSPSIRIPPPWTFPFSVQLPKCHDTGSEMGGKPDDVASTKRSGIMCRIGKWRHAHENDLTVSAGTQIIQRTTTQPLSSLLTLPLPPSLLVTIKSNETSRKPTCLVAILLTEIGSFKLPTPTNKIRARLEAWDTV